MSIHGNHFQMSGATLAHFLYGLFFCLIKIDDGLKTIEHAGRSEIVSRFLYFYNNRVGFFLELFYCSNFEHSVVRSAIIDILVFWPVQVDKLLCNYTNTINS